MTRVTQRMDTLGHACIMHRNGFRDRSKSAWEAGDDAGSMIARIPEYRTKHRSV